VSAPVFEPEELLRRTYRGISGAGLEESGPMLLDTSEGVRSSSASLDCEKDWRDALEGV
jgi:hypothetical protein